MTLTTGLLQRPLLSDGDAVRLVRAPTVRARQFFQATRDANRPEVGRKPLDFYLEHAAFGRLLHAEKDGHIIAGTYMRKPEYDRFLGEDAEESGGLFVHPDAQGWRLGGVMSRELLIARLEQETGENLPTIAAMILEANAHVARSTEARGFVIGVAPRLTGQCGGLVDAPELAG